jgi:hypothetical protein
MKFSSWRKVAFTFIAAVVVISVTACSSGGPPQSSLGPFTMTSCKMGWTNQPGVEGSPGFFTSESAANNAAQTLAAPVPASEFSITLTATADVSQFTVAYYNASGTEINTGIAYLTGDGPFELTAGQTATFEDTEAPQGATSCQVIGSNSGNE